MIRLITPKGDLDLSPDTTVEWLFQNPFFEEKEDFVPQLALPFFLPLTPTNQQLLSYAESLQVSQYSLSIPVTMMIGEVVFFRGRLNILRPGSNGYNCSIGYDRKTIKTTQSLRQFQYGGTRSGVSSAAARAAANQKFYPEIDFVWPYVWNTNHESNTRFNRGEILINDYSIGYTDREIAIPMPFLSYIIKQCFYECGGIEANGPFFDISDIKQKLIYNPVVANTTLSESLDMYLEYDWSKYTHSTTGRELKIAIRNLTSYNVQLGATIALGITEYPVGSFTPSANHTVLYTIVAGDVGNPQQLLQNLCAQILAIPATTLIMVSQDWANPTEPFFILSEATFFNILGDHRPNNRVDNLISHAAIYSPIGTYTYNDIQIAKHLPDITLKEFVNALKDGFNLTLFYNPVANTLTFTPRKDTINTQQYKDYTSQTIENYEKEIIATPKFKFVFQNDTTDTRADSETDWCAKNSPGYNDPDAQEFRIAWGHVKRFPNMPNGGLTGTGDMAWVQQKLYLYSDTDTPSFSLRLLHWNGMVNDSNATPYPKADDYFLTPDQIYTLHFEQWYKTTRLGREIAKFQIMLSLNDIIAFNPALKWKIRHNMYIWKEISMPITMKGIQPSTVRLMRIPSNANIFNTPDGEVEVE